MHIKSSVINEREHSQANLAHYENVFDSETCIKIIEKTNYVNKFYNFDVVGITEPIQFISYDGSGNEHYGWHLDMDGGFKSRRKISIVIQLSDENEYEGGELQIDTCTLDGQLTVGNKKRGSMIFFPSYLLHKVTPVTSGHRYSLVSWLSGQPYV